MFPPIIRGPFRAPSPDGPKYMGTPRLLDRFITAAEALIKIFGILLAENLLEQGGGGLGEGELAEAGIHGNGVGVGDLVEGVVLHFFFLSRGSSFRLSVHASCGAVCSVVASL